MAGTRDRSAARQQHAQRSADAGVRIDLWLIACGVHHLLFGLSPFFFAATQPDIDNYLKRFQWPTLRGLAGVELHNTDAFDYFERAYREVPDLHSLFQQSFQSGYSDPSARVDPYQWMRVIRRALLPISSPDDRTEALKQIRRYLTLALDEGTLTSSEKTFITNQGIRLGIPQAEVENIIDEEQRKWWDAVDEVVYHQKTGLRAAQPGAVASQVGLLTTLSRDWNAGGVSAAGIATILAMMLVCLTMSVWLRSPAESGVTFASPPPQTEAVSLREVRPTAVDYKALMRPVRWWRPGAHERLSTEVRRLLSDQGYSFVSARVKRSGKVYLYGAVNSPEQEEDIVWTVATIRRVRKVISHLRVTPRTRDNEIIAQRSRGHFRTGIETQ